MVKIIGAIIFSIFIMSIHDLESKPKICGIILIEGSSRVVICNSNVIDCDLSGYSISVKRVPIEILSQEIPKGTTIDADSSLEIELPFLDFPFNTLGRAKYRRYFLFDESGNCISTYKIKNREPRSRQWFRS